MAKSKVSTLKARKQKKDLSHLHLAFTTKNYMIIGAGIFLIIIGYIFLSEDSVYGFLPTVLAPIFLVTGYCVVIPYGILFKNVRSDSPTTTEEIVEEKEVKGKSSSNIRTA